MFCCICKHSVMTFFACNRMSRDTRSLFIVCQNQVLLFTILCFLYLQNVFVAHYVLLFSLACFFGWLVCRAVAQYLKKQSDVTPSSEDLYGDLSLNKILEGKTRKLCARMFFETLVINLYTFVKLTVCSVSTGK